MIITVLSYKGGVGKSTIAQNLLAYFAHSNQPSVIIDTDTNHSCVTWYSVRPKDQDLPGSAVFANLDKKTLVKMTRDMSQLYDHVIIDCPPVSSPITTRAIAAADICVVPITPTGGSDIWATEDLFEHIERLREEFDRPIKVCLLVNRFRTNVNLHKDYIETLKQYEEAYNLTLLDIVINDRVSVGLANTEGLAAVETKDKKAVSQFEELAQTLLKMA